jgi:hypothetical protein
MQRQPLEIQTIYAELLERLAALEAERAIGHAQGTFTTKTVKGQTYYYFQHSDPGGKKRQVYVGKKGDALDAVVRRFEASREDVADERLSIERLVSLLRVGGAMTSDAPSARVLRALADAGVFRQGAVLVGTHAFVVLGNVLGVRWAGGSLRTQDVDVAAGFHMSVAVPAVPMDVPQALENLEMGFVPVPALNRSGPSTSFKVRGSSLRVDLLTPARRAAAGPVALPALAASAQPLKFLDYAMEGWIAAAVVGEGGVEVNVPSPGRFALHKLLVAAERPAAMLTKREKDLWQAGQVLEVLFEDRPGDVEASWEALVARGEAWTRRVRDSLAGLERVAPGAASELRALIDR